MSIKFYVCEKCGNIIVKIKDSGMKPYCCGSVMSELIPEREEESFSEKHIPYCVKRGKKIHIKVGKIEHPQSDEHRIEWICVVTCKGWHLRYLSPNDKPEVCIKLKDDERLESVYAYCNIHGLWMCDCSEKCIEEIDEID